MLGSEQIVEESLREPNRIPENIEFDFDEEEQNNGKQQAVTDNNQYEENDNPEVSVRTISHQEQQAKSQQISVKGSDHKDNQQNQSQPSHNVSNKEIDSNQPENQFQQTAQQGYKQQVPQTKQAIQTERLQIKIRKGSIRKNKIIDKKQQVDISQMDSALRLSYRMNELRKKRQNQFYASMAKSIEVERPARKVGGIMHIRKNVADLSRSQTKKSISQKQRQKQILERSLKATQIYLIKKFIHAILFDITEKAVQKIQQKRSFFSYKFHKVLGKSHQEQQLPFKISDQINLVGAHTPRNKIKLESLEGIAIHGSRSRIMSISNAHTVSYDKKESQDQEQVQNQNQDKQSQIDSKGSNSDEQSSQNGDKDRESNEEKSNQESNQQNEDGSNQQNAGESNQQNGDESQQMGENNKETQQQSK